MDQTDIHEPTPEAAVPAATAAEANAPAPAESEAAVAAAEPAPAEAQPAAEASPAEAQPAEAPSTEAQPAATAAAPVDERRLRAQQAWERVVTARESGEVLTGTVTASVKGGLLVDVGGIRGFLPASQVRAPQGSAIESLVKTKVPLKVIDVDQSRRRIVVSHRRAMEEERRTKRAELLRSLEVGQVREGVVVRLADFGAFVDLGGVDGLIPMRELAFERVEKVSDVVKVGDRLPVEVLRIEEGGKKISLSRKNALPDPWRDHGAILRQGATVEGKVVAKEPRLQVELAPGIVGTVRESDADPADYEIGEAIEVSVRSADRRTRRIVLTTPHAAGARQQRTSTGFAPLGIELGRRS
jgi:ribosomal protein S1